MQKRYFRLDFNSKAPSAQACRCGKFMTLLVQKEIDDGPSFYICFNCQFTFQVGRHFSWPIESYYKQPPPSAEQELYYRYGAALNCLQCSSLLTYLVPQSCNPELGMQFKDQRAMESSLTESPLFVICFTDRIVFQRGSSFEEEVGPYYRSSPPVSPSKYFR